MKPWIVACGALVSACGSIPEPAPDPDPDPVCTIQNTAQSCGPSCIKCEASDRADATCNGGVCGLACRPGVPTCADASCSKLEWSFDSRTLEGITAGADTPTPVIRDRGGNPALAIDVTNLQNREVVIRLPVCVTSTLSLQTRKLQASLYLDGGNDAGLQYYAQGAVPALMAGAYLSQLSLASRVVARYDVPMSESQFAGQASAVVLRVGSFGAAFSGTIYIDDITLR